MSRRLVSLIALFAIVIVSWAIGVSCAQPEPEPAAAPQTAPVAENPDATVVDPSHYTTEFENDRVRIVRISYGAGEGSVMHFHPAGAAVFLTDALIQMTLPDGSSEEASASAGDASLTPAGQHDPKNIADAPLEVVQVELK